MCEKVFVPDSNSQKYCGKGCLSKKRRYLERKRYRENSEKYKETKKNGGIKILKNVKK